MACDNKQTVKLKTNIKIIANKYNEIPQETSCGATLVGSASFKSN